MAGRSVPAVMVLGFLVVAAFFCMAEASAGTAITKLTVINNSGKDFRVVVADVNVLDVKKGTLVVLGPVLVKLELLKLLKVQLFVFGKDGKLLAVNLVLKLDLTLLAKLVLGVAELALEVLEEVVSNEYSLIKVYVVGKGEIGVLKVPYY